MIVSVYSVASNSKCTLEQKKKTDNSLNLNTCFANFWIQNETSNIAYCAVKQFFRFTKKFPRQITFDMQNVLTKQLLTVP